MHARIEIRSSADAETARHASRWTHTAEVQNSTFFHTPVVFVGRIQDHRIIWSGLASACR